MSYYVHNVFNHRSGWVQSNIHELDMEQNAGSGSGCGTLLSRVQVWKSGLVLESGDLCLLDVQ